jgi:hypothetical protein
VLELSYLLPILGWFLILPLSVIIGAGSASLALIGLRRAGASATAPPSPAEYPV